MSLTVIKAGMLDSIQDLGRFGYQLLGINPGGAMDRFALRLCNYLVGNPQGEAVIEMHFPAPVFLFNKPALIALGGADFSAQINGEPVPRYHPIIVTKNDVLHFRQPVQGARAYLSVAGGWVSENWMGSCSTHLRAGAGGFNGRSLKKEDVLEYKQSLPPRLTPQRFTVLPWEADASIVGTGNEMGVLPGHEWETMTKASKGNFFMTDFVITRQSDRMGYRLSNIPLHRTTKEEVVSSAVSFGTVQLLPDGGLIILMSDHQTTGGYPRLAHIITAHQSRLAQLKAGDRVRFRSVGQGEAETLYIQQQQHLRQLQHACTFRLQEYFKA